jgi:hypothetical protein
LIPIALAVLITRQAISPRLAINIFSNIEESFSARAAHSKRAARKKEPALAKARTG